MHPLTPASGQDFLAGRRILADAGLVGDTTRFAYFGLEEPAKDEVLGAAEGQACDRRLRAFLIDVASGESADVVMSLTGRRVGSHRVLDPLADGRVQILTQDFELAERVVHADPAWRAAMARRGLTDVSKIRACALSAGSALAAGEETRRMVRVLAFVQNDEHDLAWAHPIDGVEAYVNLVEGCVFKVVDELELPVPEESGNYDDPEVRGDPRTGLRPIEITQPDGPSFTLDGHRLRWQNWSMRLGFDAREGLTLHQISIDDGGRERPVIYRASIPELVVPYGDPVFRYWQIYFDAGEYHLGKWANSLERGCDCLGDIAYLDATVTDDLGEPQVIANAVCIHEEDFGILWKHTDIFSGSAQTRRQRRLVVSFFTTVGNYDYGFYWYFYLDGTIECEVKMTGVLFTSGYQGNGHPYAAEVAPGLGAAVHQHLFCARLDMTVDGLANAVEEVNVAAARSGRRTLTATPSSRRSPGCAESRRPGAAPPPKGGGPGGWSAPSGSTGSPSPPATPCTRRRHRPCWPTPARRCTRGRSSPPTTSGSPGTTRRSATRRVISSTSTQAGPGSRPSSQATAISTGRTSCCGTRSARRTSRGRRTGRSCRSPGAALPSSPPGSSAGTPPWTSPRPPGTSGQAREPGQATGPARRGPGEGRGGTGCPAHQGTGTPGSRPTPPQAGRRCRPAGVRRPGQQANGEPGGGPQPLPAMDGLLAGARLPGRRTGGTGHPPANPVQGILPIFAGFID